MQRTIPKLKKINYIENPATLGEKIRNRRLELELTQKQVGKLIGIEREGLCDWENNVTDPTIEFYPTIIKFLGYVPFVFHNETLAGRVKEYRFLNGLSQENMSKQTGIGSATIMRLEHEIGRPGKHTLKLLKMVVTV